MFYQTTLQSVKNGVAVDVQGKRLNFIGYLPVQAGDTVWTDGNVIFGNVPPKGTPNIPEPLKGVPVLGKNLRGYINRQGGYKGKNIVIDDWITNDNRNFKHGKEINGQKVIDAVYLQNNSSEQNEVNLYIITEGLYRKNQCVKYPTHLFTSEYYGGTSEAVESTVAYSVRGIGAKTIYQGEEKILGTETAGINQSVKIYKDETLIKEIDLKSYADFISEKCWAVEQKLMSMSENNNVNYFSYPTPPSSFIASAYARPITFRINQKGEWDAIIFAMSYGYCFPYDVFNLSVLEGTFNILYGANTNFSENLLKCVNNLERVIFTYNYFPFLQIERYPTFTGTEKIDGEYTEEYKTYIENKIEYYIPLVRFQYSKWDIVTFGASCLLRVHDGEIISVMRLHTGGGNTTGSNLEGDETKVITYVERDKFIIPSKIENNEWEFPIDENFIFKGEGNQINFICDTSQNVIADLTSLNLNVGQYVEVDYPLKGYYDHRNSENFNVMRAENLSASTLIWGDSTIWLPAPRYTVTNSEGTTIKNYNVESKYYTAINIYENGGYNFNQNLFNSICPNLENKSNYFLMDGFFDAQSDDGFFRFNPCVCKLSDENYLIGVHEGEFFVKRNGAWEKINDNLKNFRLCEMKNLSKAKKE